VRSQCGYPFGFGLQGMLLDCWTMPVRLAESGISDNFQWLMCCRRSNLDSKFDELAYTALHDVIPTRAAGLAARRLVLSLGLTEKLPGRVTLRVSALDLGVFRENWVGPSFAPGPVSESPAPVVRGLKLSHIRVSWPAGWSRAAHVAFWQSDGGDSSPSRRGAGIYGRGSQRCR
jgi:hypothetical protein